MWTEKEMVREVARGEKYYLRKTAVHIAQISSVSNATNTLLICDLQVSQEVLITGATLRTISFSIN